MVRRFDGLLHWHPPIDTSVLEEGGATTVGALRRLRFAGGDTTVLERLTALDDLTHTDTYELVEHPFPVRRCVSTIRVRPQTDTGETFVEWSAESEVDAVDSAAAQALVRELYGTGPLRASAVLRGLTDSPRSVVGLSDPVSSGARVRRGDRFWLGLPGEEGPLSRALARDAALTCRGERQEMQAPPRGTVADRVSTARDSAFVGRETELALLRDALAGRPGAASVFYVHGPGGIGKSTLMRQYAKEARAAGRPVVHVDGRALPAAPEAFEQAAAAVVHTPGALLLIDTFEYCQSLEGWLREEFLPSLADDVLVVVAGRHAPDVTWSADPGWAGLLEVVALDDLSASEAESFLEKRGIAPAHRGPLLSFASGHPLALTLAAHVAMTQSIDVPDAGSWRPAPEVFASLLRQILGQLPGPRHRLALEVCAQAHLTSETLLRAVVGDDAPDLFAWLREQPYVDHCAEGIFPHDIVREALAADLRWRDPERFDQLYRQLHGHLLERIGSVPAERLLPAVGALQFLYRGEGHMAESHLWHLPGLVEDHPYQPSDEAHVLALAERAEGPESADTVRFWLRTRPRDFRVQRLRATTPAAAFSAWLRPKPDQGRGDDPVATAAWDHVASHGPLAAGEHIALGRFHVHPRNYQRPSPVMDLMLSRMFGELLRDSGLAWSFIVLRDDGFWNAHMQFCDMTPLEQPVMVGGSAYRLFAHDWRDLGPRAWLTDKQQTLLSGTAEGSAGADTPVPPPCSPLPSPGLSHPALSRPEFTAAVRSALRDLSRPAALNLNPLRRSRLVSNHGMTLREVLANAVAGLITERGGDKAHEVATLAFMEGAPTQEAAARRLDMPYSTYRRHLTTAVSRIEETMWRHEENGAPLLAP
ncbi:SRPBCC family protein [Streptomyces argenteolus]|uniref:SRPBCC family protein n=1 Tax=Streptomyces argenteolus TaxID=67274 RepID=A0ABW6XGS6_9ACTN